MPDLNLPQFQPETFNQSFAGAQGLQKNQINLNTLDSLNKARLSFLTSQATSNTLASQKASMLMEYAVPHEKADIANLEATAGLTNMRSKFMPQMTNNNLLSAIGRIAQANGTNDRNAIAISQTPEGSARAALGGPYAQSIVDLQDRIAKTAKSGILPGFPGAQNMSQGDQSQPMPLPGYSNDQSQRMQSNYADANVAPPVNFGANSDAVVQQATQKKYEQPASPTAYIDPAVKAIQDAASQKYKKTDLVNAPLTQKYTFAKNMLTTLKQYGNPAVTFAKYMGPDGFLRYHRDSVFNRNDPTFKNYVNFQKKIVGLGTDQVAQFLQKSVQPQSIEALESIINPHAFQLDATGSAKGWNDLMHVLHTEGSNWAENVGKKDQFLKDFKAPDEKDILSDMNGLKAKGYSAKDYLSLYEPETRNKVLSYHKGRKNG